MLEFIEELHKLSAHERIGALRNLSTTYKILPAWFQAQHDDRQTKVPQYEHFRQTKI